jgi:hypothetical protein
VVLVGHGFLRIPTTAVGEREIPGGIRLRTVGLRLDKLFTCPEPSVSSIAIYQLRVVLCGVNPLVWRRLLVVSTTSIAELHEVLQNAFGWSG